MLSKNIRELCIPFYVVDDGTKLTPISTMQLERFELSSVPYKQLKLAPNWLGKCLPLHLNSFHCSALVEPNEDISSDCIRLCRLGEAVPHLQRLYFKLSFNNSDSMGPLFASLPQNLSSLSLASLFYVFEPSAISHLPRSLDNLILSFNISKKATSKGTMTSEHFKGLPENLVTLMLTLPEIHAVDEGMIQYLPPTIAHAGVYTNAGSVKELRTKVETHVKNNACPRYR